MTASAGISTTVRTTSTGNHKDWLTCYMPLVKEDAAASNLALVPYDKLSDRDLERTRGEGAMVFLKAGAPGEATFCQEHNPEHWPLCEKGDWVGVNNYNEETYGFKLEKAYAGQASPLNTLTASYLVHVLTSDDPPETLRT